MNATLVQEVPNGVFILALLRFVLSITALSYGHRLLRNGQTRHGWPLILLCVWAWVGGVSQQESSVMGHLTWWGIGFYLLLIAVFTQLAFRKIVKEKP